MAITVTKDILHPAAYMQDRTEIGVTLWEGTAVYLVQGLDDGSSTAAALFHSRALQQPGIPVRGQLHPDPVPAAYGCIVKDRRTQTIPQSSDAVYIFVDYYTLIPQFSGGVGIMSVERSTTLANLLASAHPGTGDQIAVQNPSNAKDIFYTQIPYTLPLLKLVITAAVTPKAMDTFESAVGTVNSDSNWFNKDAGYWLFTRLQDQQQLGSGTISVQVEVVSRISRNWMDMLFFRQEVMGRDAKVSQAILNAGFQKTLSGYQFGQFMQPGLTLEGMYQTNSFSQLFGINKWP